MTQEEKDRESQVFKEIWGFRKQFYSPTDEDEYWKAVFAEADRISKQFNSEFVDTMLLACYADLESRYRKTAGMKKEKSLFEFCIKMMRCL